MSPSSTTDSPSIPQIGMLAKVRNRRGLVTTVDAFDGGAEGRVHLVSIEYLDPDGPQEDQLIWEREPEAGLLQPSALPEIGQQPPMDPSELDALIRATRWSAMSPYIDPDAGGPLDRLPLSSPVHGAIQVEDFQLVPLWKAMRMPRVALLLADDVGLGKTIEAGLILTELLLRRRVRRVLIVCPASLRTQWKQEMHGKFSLHFDIIDRAATHELQKRLGLDANPWRTFHRVITSYDYLKQADIFEQFHSATRTRENSELAHLPWDLLVVDEAHNLSPSSFGDDSDAARLLQWLSPMFEHRLFLTATPHNGHTRSFTGLLESLDPVRFTRKSDALTDDEKERIKQVVIRRLKSEINALTDPPRFAERYLEAVPITLGPAESELAAAFETFKRKVKSLVQSSRSRKEEMAGSFAIEVLGKRLLSCPSVFANSWHRYKCGLASDEAASSDEVGAAQRAVDEETADDLEAEGRAGHAAETVGAWLKPLADQLHAEIANLDSALRTLGLASPPQDGQPFVPNADVRFDALLQLIESKLLSKGKFREDERLVVFTEYKTTLDYLEFRLRKRFPEDDTIRTLFGERSGTGGRSQRDATIAAFNDPEDPVRILISTDAASEGLNLQESARYLFHYDVPWNPSRLEQRNGRLDRHGQARDVTVHHFSTDDEGDLKFLAYVVGKVHQIREDLGSAGEVFDKAVERRLISGDNFQQVLQDLEQGLQHVRGQAMVPREEAREDMGTEQLAKLEALKQEVDLDPDSLRQTLEVALGMGRDSQPLEGPDGRGRFRLRHIPPEWRSLVDDSLRLPSKNNVTGAIPSLVFDPALLLKSLGKRKVFRPDPDSTLLHLNHPLFHRALADFARRRFPGSEQSRNASRWTVRTADIPTDSDGLLLLTVEELAVNELRETFHHWVHTLQIPIRNGELGAPLPHAPARQLRLAEGTSPHEAQIRAAVELWSDVEIDVREMIEVQATELTRKLEESLAAMGQKAVQQERDRYQRRHGEISKLIESNTKQRLQSELEKKQHELNQHHLFDEERRFSDLRTDIAQLEGEIARRERHYQELREQLSAERDRVLDHILPKRFAMRGQAQVFPVAVEMRLPESMR